MIVRNVPKCACVLVASQHLNNEIELFNALIEFSLCRLYGGVVK